MGDLINNWPSWGESGTYPPNGFKYDGGDQVNEKHLDALWDGIDTHVSNINTAIRDRVRDLDGNVVLDDGLVASQGANTREVDVSNSNDGAYVDGEKTGSVSSTTLTLSTNGTGGLRTDVIYLDDTGTVDKTENTSSPPSGTLKIAEVDVTTSDTIDAIRNYARDHTYAIASENAPSNPEEGDVWSDLTNDAYKVYLNGSWQELTNQTVSDQFGSVEVFTADGTFDASKVGGNETVWVECVGAGGGGGGASGNAGFTKLAGGGGGGGYAADYVDVSNTNSVTVTVGTGGAGGAAGDNDGSGGGSSSFGSFVQANGGNGGSNGGASSLPSNGGGASSGTVQVTGGRGDGATSVGTEINYGSNGEGGDSAYGSGQPGGRTASSRGGNPGNNPGVGGGGWGAIAIGDAAGDQAGGDGADGIVIVHYDG